MRPTRNVLLATAVGALAAIAALCAFLPVGAPLMKPVTVHPGWHDIDRRIDAAGTIRPTAVVHVGALVSGIVVSTTVDAGDRVRAGQLIAAIDDAPYRLQLDRARALARAAQRRADDASRHARREHELLRAGFVSPAAVESADDQSREANEDVGVANADVEAARINLAHCRIESPISGTVLSKEISAGQSVAASFQVPDLFTIVSRLDQLEVVALFAEADLAHVVPGASVTLHVPAFPDVAFSASVERVLDTPESRQGIVVFPVLLTLANERGLLRPGMTTYAELHVVARPHVLAVPNQAISFARAQDRAARPPLQVGRRLYVWRFGAVRPVAVKLGASDDTRTEIIPVDALDERDDVLLSPTR